MKKNIVKILNELIDLFSECKFNEDISKYIKVPLNNINKLNQNTVAYRENLLELKSIFGGMGSFSDLPIYPQKGSKYSKMELWKKKEQLEEILLNEIQKELDLSSKKINS